MKTLNIFASIILAASSVASAEDMNLKPGGSVSIANLTEFCEGRVRPRTRCYCVIHSNNNPWYVLLRYTSVGIHDELATFSAGAKLDDNKRGCQVAAETDDRCFE